MFDTIFDLIDDVIRTAPRGSTDADMATAVLRRTGWDVELDGPVWLPLLVMGVRRRFRRHLGRARAHLRA